MSHLYGEIDAFETGFIQVSEDHNLYYEISGNPEGKPAIVFHGGPGGGSSPFFRRYFDPKVYKIFQFDQRGSGLSTPHASLENNTTWHLVEDIEKIRERFKVEKWHTVLGGSWGTTLALAYSQTHPERVGHIVLRATFLLRKEEINFFYQEGSSWLFPDYHDQLKSILPKEEQHDILEGYWKRLNGDDEEVKLKFAKAWTTWEMATSSLFLNQEKITLGEDPKFALAFARIETHYFKNNGFFKENDQLLANAHLIKDIPTIIVHGRYDVVCPLKSSYDLKQKLNNCELIIVPDAGHSGSEIGISANLVKATDKFKNDD